MRPYRTLTLLALIALLGGCAAVRSVSDDPSPTASTPTTTDGLTTPTMARLELSGEPHATRGDPAAPVTMIEFSDYGCPFCRAYANDTFPELKQRYIDSGKLFYVFKDFPIVELHPQAPLAAEAAECAGAQGRYWEMHERLFAAPEEWSASPDTARATFRGYADELQLDTAAFQQCLDNGRFRANVELNVTEALRLGFTGTPTFIIQDTLLSGAQATQVFTGLVERKLKEQATP
ncbi:DsbA family protein [Kallotenue papyrolyticum]|uniref:DsbA family protein n=1 Tax=Kallotenue papyrolyticum TaxID=1325125 RepID=UPI00046F01C2|nr:thioredoxin domain-containing protein [Kallotenue papyrolyticum]